MTELYLIAAHMIYGEALTINAANYVYFIAMKECQKFGNFAALSCFLGNFRFKLFSILNAFLDEMINLHKGQGLDIYWRESSTCPSLEDYKYMVSCSKLQV
jgi:geranylgeranyl diphosphate synthase type 3